MELISQNHGSLCLYTLNKHFKKINNRIVNIMIHYNHIEILLKEVCDVGPLFT